MNRCPYCRKRVWPWQDHIFTLHRLCLEIFCQGYAQGVKVVSEQAGKIVADMQRQLVVIDGPTRMQ